MNKKRKKKSPKSIHNNRSIYKIFFIILDMCDQNSGCAQNIIIPLKHLFFSEYWPGLRVMKKKWIRKIVLHIPINCYSI